MSRYEIVGIMIRNVHNIGSFAGDRDYHALTSLSVRLAEEGVRS